MSLSSLVNKKRPADPNRERAEEKRQKKEYHAILQLILIVGSFAIGYLPNTSKYSCIL